MRPALVTLLLALVLAGCGAGSSDSAKDFKGQQKGVATAIEDLETAGRDDEPVKICSQLLARSLLTRLREAGTNCRTAVSQALDDADQFDLEVDSVRIAGTKATARVTSGSGDDEKQEPLQLEREGAAWKVATLGAG